MKSLFANPLNCFLIHTIWNSIFPVTITMNFYAFNHEQYFLTIIKIKYLKKGISHQLSEINYGVGVSDTAITFHNPLNTK